MMRRAAVRIAAIRKAGLFAAAALALAAGAAQAQQTVATDTAIATAVEPSLAEIIAIENERYRRMTVPVTIAGQGPFRFMIDTGAQATVLSRELADRLQLFDRQEATLVAMASTRQVETTTVADFTLGSRSFTVQTAPLVEAAHIGQADGILGLDSLQRQRVLFDFEANTLAVADADTLGGNRGFDIVVRARQRLGQLIIHRAELDGVDVAVIIDTGAQGSIGNPQLLQRLRRARAFDDATMTDVNGVSLTGETRVARMLELGEAGINNFLVTFADSPTFAKLGLADEPAMVLGMAELRLFRRVAIDFTTRQVLFDLPRNASLADTRLFGPGSGTRTPQY